MNLSHLQLRNIGGILFFIGLICIFYSWFHSYPIYYSAVNIPIFFQFEPILWPGVVVSLVGLFIVGYVSRKIVIILILEAVLRFILLAKC